MGARLIDAGRFLDRFAEMAGIGGTPGGGVHRLAASAEDGAARDRLRSWFDALGLQTRIDTMGNMAGVLDLAGAGAPVILAGSHLDSQPGGGRFDGALGVVAAYEAATVLDGAARSGKIAARCNLAVVNWTNEEGARFQPSLLGSGVFVGQLDGPAALARQDAQGVALGDALETIGYRGGDVLPHPAAYVELHVECARVLEQAGASLGIFTQYWGAVKHRVAFIGAQAHTGPTPMAERRDAVLGAAYLIAALRDMVEQAPGILHSSTGRIDITPNSPNIVPAEAVLFVELRSVDPAVLAWAEAALQRCAAAAAERARVDLQWRGAERRPAGRFDAKLAGLCRAEAAAAGFAARDLATVPGHDAISLSSVCPAVMLTVPSAGGICHDAAEFTAPADLVTGAEVLTRVLWRLCSEGLPA